MGSPKEIKNMEFNKMRTSMIVLCVLAALTVGIASAKSYDFILSGPATAGSHQLTADQRYSVQVKGAEAVITGAVDRKSISVPVKAEEGTKKYDTTTVEIANAGGAAVIRAIRLGGSKTRLVFAE